MQTNPTPSEPTWHQQQAAGRRHATRNLPAHILDDARPLVSLCGHARPRVTIDPWHRGNPDNRPCKRCLAIADARSLPTEEPRLTYPIAARPWPY